MTETGNKDDDFKPSAADEENGSDLTDWPSEQNKT